MIRQLTFAACLAMSISAHANTPPVGSTLCDGLTTAQCLELATTAEKLKTATPVGVTPDRVQDWAVAAAGVAAALGDGIVTTAAKLGVEANKFAESDLGKFTLILIAWHIFGEAAIGILLGTAILIIGNILIWWMLRNVTRAHQVVIFSKDKTTWWGAPKIERREFDHGKDQTFETFFYACLAELILIIVCGLIIF